MLKKIQKNRQLNDYEKKYIDLHFALINMLQVIDKENVLWNEEMSIEENNNDNKDIKT